MVTAQGSLSSLMRESRFMEFSNNSHFDVSEDEDDTDDSDSNHSNLAQVGTRISRKTSLRKGSVDERRRSIVSEEELLDNTIGALTTKVEMQSGQIKANVYGYFIKQAGIKRSTLCIVLFGLFTLLKIGLDWWVGNNVKEIFESKTSLYKYYFVGLFLLLSFMLCFRARKAG